MDEHTIILKKTRDGKTLIHHNGFTYKLKYEGSTSTLYWCTLNRSNGSNCSAKSWVFKTTGFQESIGYHSSKYNHRKKSKLVSSSALVDITNLPCNSANKLILDYTEEMLKNVIQLALADVSCRATAIRRTVSD